MPGRPGCSMVLTGHVWRQLLPRVLTYVSATVACWAKAPTLPTAVPTATSKSADFPHKLMALHQITCYNPKNLFTVFPISLIKKKTVNDNTSPSRPLPSPPPSLSPKSLTGAVHAAVQAVSVASMVNSQ